MLPYIESMMNEADHYIDDKVDMILPVEEDTHFDLAVCCI